MAIVALAKRAVRKNLGELHETIACKSAILIARSAVDLEQRRA